MLSRQRREGCQPGASPRVSRPRPLSRPERAEGFPAHFQGAQKSMDSETQGVALGLHPAALSAPKDVNLAKPSRIHGVHILDSERARALVKCKISACICCRSEAGNIQARRKAKR